MMATILIEPTANCQLPTATLEMMEYDSPHQQPQPTIVQVSDDDKLLQQQQPSKLTRVLLEWVFSLRKQLASTSAANQRLAAQNAELRHRLDDERVTLLHQVQRDAERVTRTMRAKDQRIAALKAECSRLQAENARYRRHLEDMTQLLFVSPSPAAKSQQQQQQQQQFGTLRPAASSVILSPTLSTSPPTTSVAIASSSTDAQPSSRFGKSLIHSLKNKLGKLGSSSRKLKSEHRDKFRSSETISNYYTPTPSSSSSSALEQQQARRSSLAVPTAVRRNDDLEEVENSDDVIMHLQPVGGSNKSGKEPLLDSPDLTNKEFPTSTPPSSSTTGRVQAPPRTRKCRVSISDPPARSECLAATAQLQEKQLFFNAKSCNDLSEETAAVLDELENSVSPFSSSGVASCSSQNVIGSGKDSGLSDEQKEDSHEDDDDESSPSDFEDSESEMLATATNTPATAAAAANNSKPAFQRKIQPPTLEDTNRRFGNRQTRFSHRKFTSSSAVTQKRFGSAHHVGVAVTASRSAPVESNARPKSDIPATVPESPTTSGQVVRSRSSPSAENAAKLRGSLKQRQSNAEENVAEQQQQPSRSFNGGGREVLVV